LTHRLRNLFLTVVSFGGAGCWRIAIRDHNRSYCDRPQSGGAIIAAFDARAGARRRRCWPISEADALTDVLRLSRA
jgi:hypothetical protein